MRRRWTTPKLVVLFRGSPEERVLTQCKDVAATWPEGPLEFENKCDEEHIGGTINCQACQAMGTT